MSNGSVTTVTRQSWLGRIGGAIKSVVLGLVLFVLAFPLLWWNEGRAVTTYKSLTEGSRNVVPIQTGQVDPDNEGRLVHLTGQAATDDVLTDDTFDISATAIRLRRIVEMYQWQESTSRSTQKKVGGATETTTTYSYSKTWSETPIDSSRFQNPQGHTNPGSLPWTSRSWQARNVALGAFTLNDAQIGGISGSRTLPARGAEAMPAVLRERNATVHDDGYYVGAQPSQPQVGDVRIRFETTGPAADVSIVARQTGSSFSPYQTQAGRALQMLTMGTHAADAMFQQAQAANVRLTWLLRAAGLVLMWVGLGLVFGVLSVLADLIPILGDVVGAGVKFVTLLVSAVLSLVTISIAWIYHRPVLGAALLALSVALAYLAATKLRKAHAAAPATPPQPAAG